VSLDEWASGLCHRYLQGLDPENEDVTVLCSLTDTPAHQQRFESLARLL